MDTVAKCLKAPEETSTTAIVATTVVATVALLSLGRHTLWPTKPKVFPGPLTTSFPEIPKAERDKIVYKPDHFPGARDVVTPYGNIHVYEWGPEDGRKVLFLHGISTSCLTLEDIVYPLVERGCRVMLFDLFGRGYSDAPGDVEYDTRLFVSQILLVLASSKLAWTGDKAFSIIGYSLGGGIAANFTATFPNMVDTLIMLAPAGLIRAENFGKSSRLIFRSGVVPERLLAWLTKKRLRTPIDNAVSKRRKPITNHDEKETIADVAIKEAADMDDHPTTGPTAFEKRVVEFVYWTLDHHVGFVPAFMSTIRYAPMLEQHDYWRKLAKRERGTTAVLLGKHDNLVQHEDYVEDALPLLGGEDNVFWRVVPGAHNFPFTHPKEALEQIYKFWGWDQQ